MIFEEVETASTTTTSIIAASVVTGLVLGMAASGSSVSIWFLVNLHQLIELLLLFNTYMDDDFTYYVLDLDIFSMNFEFTASVEIPVVDSWFNKFDYPQPNGVYEDSGFESSSFLVNYYAFIRILFLVI